MGTVEKGDKHSSSLYPSASAPGDLQSFLPLTVPQLQHFPPTAIHFHSVTMPLKQYHARTEGGPTIISYASNISGHARVASVPSTSLTDACPEMFDPHEIVPVAPSVGQWCRLAA